MNVRICLIAPVVAGLLVSLASGCGESTDIKVAPAAPASASEVKEVPKDPKKGGGKSSSGNMNRNPGGNS